MARSGEAATDNGRPEAMGATRLKLAQESATAGGGDVKGAMRLPVSAMPTDYSISLRESVRGGTDTLLVNPPTERRQSMRGFEPQYVDSVDYIVRITHRIWEEKDIGYIYDTYRHNSRVMDDAGLQYGRDKVIGDTINTVNAFPDIRLYTDEIIWAGSEELRFFTSHRTVITRTNTGYSRFGLPTGKRINVWCIANCLAQDNEISRNGSSATSRA